MVIESRCIPTLSTVIPVINKIGRSRSGSSICFQTEFGITQSPVTNTLRWQKTKKFEKKKVGQGEVC